jgi:hypothetical protein
LRLRGPQSELPRFFITADRGATFRRFMTVLACSLFCVHCASLAICLAADRYLSSKRCDTESTSPMLSTRSPNRRWEAAPWCQYRARATPGWHSHIRRIEALNAGSARIGMHCRRSSASPDKRRANRRQPYLAAAGLRAAWHRSEVCELPFPTFPRCRPVSPRVLWVWTCPILTAQQKVQ